MAWSSSLCASDKLRFLGETQRHSTSCADDKPWFGCDISCNLFAFLVKKLRFQGATGWSKYFFFTFTIIYQLLLVKSQIKTWSNIYLYSTRILEFPIDLFRPWRKSSAIPLCRLGSGLVAPAGGCWNFGRWMLGRRAAVMKKRGGVYNGYIGFIYIYSNI